MIEDLRLRVAGLAAVLLLAVGGWASEPTPLGTITMHHAIGWDSNTETNLAGYNLYVGSTNLTGFAKVATVTTNRWPGAATQAIHGPKAFYLTAFNTAGLESEPSAIYLVVFRAGVPLPPKNVQLFTVVTAAATNALPPLPPSTE